MQQAQQRHTPTQSQALGMAQIDAATFPVASSKQDGTYYLVREDGTGSYTCTCGDYVHRKAATCSWCKHIAQVAATQAPNAARPSPSRCFACGEWPVKGHDLICEHCAGKVRESDAADVAATQHLMGETMRDLLAATPTPAERNARAASLHRFQEGSQTLIAGIRPSPLESAGYGR